MERTRSSSTAPVPWGCLGTRFTVCTGDMANTFGKNLGDLASTRLQLPPSLKITLGSILSTWNQS